MAATGGTHPRLEQLLTGVIPGVPRVELIHALLSIESGAEWVHNLVMAERGELDAPYVITWEGSVMDETTAGEGHWMGLGQDPDTSRQATSMEWLDRLAPGAAAVIAIGTCATWGGIPAAKGNPTNAMSVTDHLGSDYRSAAGVPIVNVPGCSPVGDNYLETAAATLLFLQGLAPAPEFDDLGRPAWLFGDTAPALPEGRLLRRRCVRPGGRRQGVPRGAGLLGPGGAVQHRRARDDRRPRWMHAGRGHLHRLHHARLSRQVLTNARDAAGLGCRR